MVFTKTELMLIHLFHLKMAEGTETYSELTDEIKRFPIPYISYILYDYMII
jgi:hypothetical protein